MNAMAAASFRCEPETSRITLNRMSAKIDNGDGNLSVLCGTGLTWENGAFSWSPMSFNLKMNSLRFRSWNRCWAVKISASREAS